MKKVFFIFGLLWSISVMFEVLLGTLVYQAQTILQCWEIKPEKAYNLFWLLLPALVITGITGFVFEVWYFNREKYLKEHNYHDKF